MLKALRWSKALAFIAGGGLTTAFAATGNPKLIAGGVVLMSVAGLLTQLVPNPATAVAADAPVVDEGGKTIGINVSNTSTIPITAPQKG